MQSKLDEEQLRRGADELAERFGYFRSILDQYGYSSMWDRSAGFASLLKIILEQQVSLASAQATYDKLQTRIEEVTPENFLALGDDELRVVGFSRQKTRYGRILAEEILTGKLDLSALADMSDSDVSERLCAIKGIGRWTSDIYLLMVLLRPDVWPKGDLALLISYQEVLELGERPSQDELEKLAAAWAPWRAIAARLLWHSYLKRRSK